MIQYADLEIGLHRYDAARYAVEFRFNQPGSDADVRLGPSNPVVVQFDFETLRAKSIDPKEYGQVLTQSLFSDPALKSAFDQARASAQSLDVGLRLQLFIGPSAPELHSLRWETLRDPQNGSLLLTGEQILFSRYLSSFDWRPVRLRPRGDLRILVVIANPFNLAVYNLTSLDTESELTRAPAGPGPSNFKLRLTSLSEN